MDEDVKLEWVDKYAPKTIDDMVLDDSIRKQFVDIIDGDSLPSMTLAGINGIGKTTLATILAKEFNAITMFHDCGKYNSVDDVKNIIAPFCESGTIDNRLKVVILDESDQLSGGERESSAQKSLRGVINDAKDTRFILTCNYPNDIKRVSRTLKSP